MKKPLLNKLPLLLSIMLLTACSQKQTAIQKTPLLVDTHNDILSNELITHLDMGKLQTTGNFDLVRAKEGGLNA